jgi:hypothetical protein
LQNRTIDLVGQRFGRLVVVEHAGGIRRRGALWRCLCDCGKITLVCAGDLKKKRDTGDSTVSCGCWRKQRAKLDSTSHGMTNTPEFRAWTSMRQRCSNPSHLSWHRYGGRGIKVCEAWMGSFEAFFEHVGPRPTPKHSLDRFPNNNGNYEPGNVRWATSKEQAANRSNSKLSDLDVKFVRLWRSRGYKVKDIAAVFDANPAYVGAICNDHIRRLV